jgi:histidine triad (HIT) family protein
MTDCLFCRIVRGEIPAKLVAQNDDAIAFRDIDPRAPVHILVVPREHVASMNDADPATLGAVLALAADVARQEGVTESGYRVVINTGEHAGQTVHHLHAHLLGGRDMAWPPG